MKQDQYIYLIYQQSRGALMPSDEQLLEDWLKISPDHVKIRATVLQSMDLMADFEPDFQIDAEGDYDLIKKQLDFSPATAKVKMLNSRRMWLSIAATIALLVATIFIYQSQQTSSQEWISLTTALGEKQHISLADGSTVQLNENSQLRYTTSFTGAKRVVELKGEAFFDIEKNPKQPFLIQTPASTVQVLGTSFNVRARDQEAFTSVSVKTGRVAFSTKDSQQSVNLEADQESVLQHDTKQLSTPKTISADALFWQDRTLTFKNTPLTEVFKTLEETFKIEIENKNSKLLSDCRFSSKVQVDKVDQIFEMLKAIFNIKVKQDGKKKYIITGGSEC